MNMNQYLLIDIGGSAVKYAVSDDDLNLTQNGKAPLAMASPREDVYVAIQNILSSVSGQVQGIAISMPGIIDYKKGFAYRSSMLKDGNVPVREDLEKLTGLPVSVINDGYSAGMAELGYGNLKDTENGVVLVLGTGIGGALILNHELYTGKDNSAANMSFIYSDINNPADRSTMFSFQNGIRGLKNAVRETSSLEDIDGLKAFQLISEGNEQVKAGVELFCDRLAFQLYNLQAILDLDRVLIGGGISNEPSFITYVQEAADRRWDTALIKLKKPEIMNCRFNSDANLFGALYNWKQLHQ